MLYSETILIELLLPEFIIGGHNINHTRYTDFNVKIADVERKPHEFLQSAVNEEG